MEPGVFVFAAFAAGIIAIGGLAIRSVIAAQRMIDARPEELKAAAQRLGMAYEEGFTEASERVVSGTMYLAQYGPPCSLLRGRRGDGEAILLESVFRKGGRTRPHQIQTAAAFLAAQSRWPEVFVVPLQYAYDPADDLDLPGFQQLELDEDEFDMEFEVWARDPAAARALLSPEMRAYLLSIKEQAPVIELLGNRALVYQSRHQVPVQHLEAFLGWAEALLTRLSPRAASVAGGWSVAPPAGPQPQGASWAPAVMSAGEGRFCQQCGSPTRIDARFCPRCGRPV